MITERLSDPQLYALMGIILGLGLAGLVTVIAWPLRDRPLEGGADRWVRR